MNDDRTFSSERFLKELPELDTDTRAFRRLLEHHRQNVVGALRRAVYETTGRVRLKAAHILLELGDPEGNAVLLDGIASDDPELRKLALFFVAFLPWKRDEDGYPSCLDKAAVFAAIAPLTADEPLVRTILERLGTEEADRRVAGLIDHKDPAVRVEVAKWLALRGEDRGTLAVVEEFVFDESLPKYSHLLSNVTDALQYLCERGDGDARQRACRLAMDFVRSRLDDNDNYIANYVWHCLKGIAKVAPAEEPELLQAVIASGLPWWVRGIALRLMFVWSPSVTRVHPLCTNRQNTRD